MVRGILGFALCVLVKIHPDSYARTLATGPREMLRGMFGAMLFFHVYPSTQDRPRSSRIKTAVRQRNNALHRTVLVQSHRNSTELVLLATQQSCDAATG